MSSVAARPAPSAGVTLADRVVAAVPLATLFTWLVLAYAWQAWLVTTPFVFIDELKLTQLARSVAEGGVPALRGETTIPDTLVALLTAPAWLIGDVHTAYLAAKLLGVATMTAALFPAYGLARMLVSRRWALFAAAGAVAVPGVMYAFVLLEEPYAYFVSTLSLFLIVRALAGPTRRTIAAAAIVALLAPLVRQQLAVLPVILGLSGAVVWWTGERARRWRASWSGWDWAGAVALVALVAIVANAVISHESFTWEETTRYHKGRVLEYGLWAGGALAIGLGILPVVASLALLGSGRRWARGRTETAFLAVLGTSVAAFGFYAAIKAAFLSLHFATRVAERNLIYLAPLFFVATAAFLERPRLRLPALAVSAAFVATLIVVTPIQLDFPYFEAVGFSILAAGNRLLYLPAATLEGVLLGAFAVAVLLVLALRLVDPRFPRAARIGAAGIAALVLAWTASGELYASAGARNASEAFVANLPRPVDWLDRETGGESALYLGQNIVDPNGIHLLEFWNRSLDDVWSLDGTAPGPGRVVTPDLATASGELFPDPGFPYVVADGEIEVVGTPITKKGQWTLFRVDPPLRLAYSRTGVFSDGWMGESSAYNRFATPDGRSGTMKVTLSRLGWGGEDVPGRVTVRIGTLTIGEDKQPALGDVTATCEWTAHSSREHACRLATPPPPFRVEVTVAPTFVPAELDPRISDRRALGVQVGYEFVARDAAQR